MNAFKMNKNTKTGKSAGPVHQSTINGSSHIKGISPTSSGILSPFYSMGPVLSLKGMVQPKLTIGQPNDRYEQEADRVADQVMRMPEPKKPLVQRQSACHECPEKEEVRTKPVASKITPLVQRQAGEEEEEEVQTKLVEGSQVQRQEEEEPVQAKQFPNKSPHVNRGLQNQVRSLSGNGQPLSESVRGYFESRIGADFSQVRVHKGAKAAETAKSINAKAFTLGKDMVFGLNQYSPGTLTGKRLLAHELTHVVQQRQANAAAGSGMVQRQGGAPPPAPPTAVNFSSPDPVHVPSCGPFRARANIANVTWSLLPDPTAVHAGTTISNQGRNKGKITIGPKQSAGKIKARATNAGGWGERPFRIRSHPTGINRTFVAGGPPNPAANYGAAFDHVFVSHDGNVASLDNVAVGERFKGVPNPTGAVHNITFPTNPFGGTFTFRTKTLTPGATSNWFLTPAGQLGGTHDRVTSLRAGINVGHFIQSASNPRPKRALPADMTLIQSLYWYCPQAAAARRWKNFINAAHSRTLRKKGGNVEFVTTVNGVEQIDNYSGRAAVYNLTASPVSTPRSAAPPAAPRRVNITASTLPTAIPAGQPLRFSIVGNKRGCTIVPNPANNHAAVLTVGRTGGTVVVQAADSTNVNDDRVTVTIT